MVLSYTLTFFSFSLYHSFAAFIVLGSVVQRLDNAIHWINRYPVDSAVRFLNSYPMHSDLSVG